ncbi:SHOCT domain-containing protein [Sphaerisporangium corydalis]|uniref:SHOCT domain-containing protein n=1 Tax=Sphaerisporangium corydalis TaxID=1441875 RepID=A0ABV9E872_9ACTN|nr:hypothetical protein [Sphaerisporangium corydalis]
MYMFGLAMNGWEALLLTLSCVLVWATIIGGVRSVLQEAHSTSARAGTSPEEDLLFERFAHGEIGDDEYRYHREALRGTPHACEQPCR